MKIVAVSEEDWRDLKEIRLTSLSDSPAAFGIRYEDAEKYSTEDWKQRASGDIGPRFLIAYFNEKPVGIIGGVFENNEYELISMWVSPESRGIGIGQKLIEALKEHATKEGHRCIMLKVSPDNLAACNLYYKCGFRLAGEGGSLTSDQDIQLQKMKWPAGV